MLLRVDVYPCSLPQGHDGTIVNQDIELSKPSQTLYPCLATCSSGDGKILSVGRKTGDVVLANDKSASRDHCVLRVVSSSASLVTAAATAPRNDAEQQACQANSDHMCLVLEGIGRLGCYVVQEPIEETKSVGRKPTSSKQRQAKDGDGEDSETDDDEDVEAVVALAQSQAAAAASGMPAMSHIAQVLTARCKNNGRAAAFLKLVGPEQTYILDPHLRQHRRVIVQCGKLGSTLVIQRQAIHFVTSRNENIGRTLQAKLPLIDAHETTFASSSQDDNDSHGEDDDPNYPAVTHYLVKARSATPSQLTAWCYGIPICKPDYLLALLERTQPNDPLPDPKAAAFEPKSDGQAFWYQTPPPKLWKSWTFMSTADDEMEQMIRAAGATIVALYDIVDPQDALAQAKLLHAKSDYCFALKSSSLSSSRNKKLSQLLQTTSIPHITLKDVAKRLSKQQCPDGSDPRTISMETTTNTTLNQSSLDLSVLEDSTASRADMTGASVETTLVANKRGKEDAADVAKSQSKLMDVITTDFVVEEASQPRGNKRRAVSAQERQEDESKKGNNNDQSGQVKKRIKLDTSASGWLTTAPKGSKRKQYVRTKAEIIEATGNEDIIDAAPTERCKGLIVHTVSPDDPPQQQHTRHRSNQVSVPGPNFKAFRKNSVPQHPVGARIRLRAVLPMESQRREFDEERKELEEQQRRADELFRDAAVAANRRRRR